MKWSVRTPFDIWPRFSSAGLRPWPLDPLCPPARCSVCCSCCQTLSCQSWPSRRSGMFQCLLAPLYHRWLQQGWQHWSARTWPPHWGFLHPRDISWDSVVWLFSHWTGFRSLLCISWSSNTERTCWGRPEWDKLALLLQSWCMRPHLSENKMLFKLTF